MATIEELAGQLEWALERITRLEEAEQERRHLTQTRLDAITAGLSILNENAQRLDGQVGGVVSDVAQLTTAVTGLAGAVENLAGRTIAVQDGLAAVQTRLGRVEERLDMHAARFDGIEETLSLHDGRFDKLDDTLREVLRRLPAGPTEEQP